MIPPLNPLISGKPKPGVESTAGLLFCSSVKRVEARWMQQTAPGELMHSAAQALTTVCGALLRNLPRQSTDPANPAGTPVIAAFVGPGNNGADALLCLHMLRQQGYPGFAGLLSTTATDPTTPTTPEYAVMLSQWRDTGGAVMPLAALLEMMQGFESAGRPILILDGLFGIGLNRPLPAQAMAAAAWTHEPRRAAGPVVAVDVPSGLNADTGCVLGCETSQASRASQAVRATHTVTFIADKPGLHTGRGRDFSGTVIMDSLGVSNIDFDGWKIDSRWAGQHLQARALSTHKGSFGTVAAVGGARGMPGAVLLADRGARAAGAGKVATLSPDEPVFDSGEPQMMAWSCNGGRINDRTLETLTAVAVGCGLGDSNTALILLRQLLSSHCALAVDADALNLLSHDEYRSSLTRLIRARVGQQATVITPHPLEAARLLGIPTAQVQSNRIAAAKSLADQLQCVVLLKGAGSILADPHGQWAVVCAGGPALATGGTGDVLSGMVAGLLARGYSSWNAAALAAWVHGDAADRWSKHYPLATGLPLGDLLCLIVDGFNQQPNWVR
ncbi:MAG: NAD(P)H-hydrate dehydratase [Burkholderiaceae bacterium]